MHQPAPYSDDSDSSEASDSPSDLSRADAVNQFPEACHQALAATLGLVYYKIRKEDRRRPQFPPDGPPGQASAGGDGLHLVRLEAETGEGRPHSLPPDPA